MPPRDSMQQSLALWLTQLRSVWQYRWHAIAFTWLLCLVGWVAVFFIPNKYQATARVYVDTQSILRPLLQGLTVQPNVDQLLAMMTRTLLSRPNIERVIATAGLAPADATPAERERIADRLAKHIELRSADQNNLYTLMYTDKSPADAKKVVQALLTMLLEGSAGEKRKDTVQAQQFLGEQIGSYEARLAQAENTLRDFKQRNLGFVPGQDYFTRLNDTGSALASARLELREAENARDALRSQIPAEEAPGSEPASSDLEARIQALRKNLDNLRLNFTEEHPDVTGAKRVLATLEEQRRQALAAIRKSGAPSGPRGPNVQLALAESEALVASLRARVSEYESRYNAMRAAVNRIPQLEAEYAQLNRDYEVNKQNFEKLLSRRESATITQAADSRSGLADFRVVDPPRVPLAPTSPNRPALLSLVLAVGIAGGLALAVLFAQIRPTFTDRRTLKDVTGLPILGQVAAIRTADERRRLKRNLFAWGGTYIGLLAAYGGILATLVVLTRGAA